MSTPEALTQEEVNVLPFTDAERVKLLESQGSLSEMVAKLELISAQAAHLRDVLPIAQRKHDELLSATVAAARSRQTQVAAAPDHSGPLGGPLSGVEEPRDPALGAFVRRHHMPSALSNAHLSTAPDDAAA